MKEFNYTKEQIRSAMEIKGIKATDIVSKLEENETPRTHQQVLSIIRRKKNKSGFVRSATIENVITQMLNDALEYVKKYKSIDHSNTYKNGLRDFSLMRESLTEV